MIQLGAVGNKSSQVMSRGKTSLSDLQVTRGQPCLDYVYYVPLS